MELYKALITKTEQVVTAYSPEFDTAIDADCMENAIFSLKRVVEEAGVTKLKNGGILPTPVDTKPEENQMVAYFTTDIDAKFKNMTSSSVRKNISLPEWMDIKLRANNIDASSLFQEAAIAKINELEQPTKHISIDNVETLKRCVDEAVLVEYMKQYMSNL